MAKHKMKQRVFLESEPFGREYFDTPNDQDLVAQVGRVLETSVAQFRRDGIDRSVGIQVYDPDNQDCDLPESGNDYEDNT